MPLHHAIPSTHLFLRISAHCIARPRLATFALAAIMAGLQSSIAFAADATVTGAPGTNGASGLLGAVGGKGEEARTELSSSDLANTANAVGGKGGNGGASFPLLPGGRGGDGGRGASTLRVGGQSYPPDIGVQSENQVIATGGDGGQGGRSLLLRGAGGSGGGAIARAVDTGSAGPETLVESLLQLDANGGRGGNGGNGGAGGSAVSFGRLAPGFTTATNITLSNARGGDGGNGIFAGGRGGNANAETALGVINNGNFSTSTANAIGGNGGVSRTGRYGDGGDATARVEGTASEGDINITLNANAVGGNSGSGPQFGMPRGRGGDATATTRGGGPVLTEAYLTSIARGGDGVAQGGNAIANVRSHAEFYAGADAEASGGAGRQAGAALAAAAASSSFAFYGASAAATANYAGPFVRQVQAEGANIRVYDNSRPFPGTAVYAQASAGDTSGLSNPPTAPARTSMNVQALAPTPMQAAAALIDNPNIAATFADGSVWGMGKIATNATLYSAGDASLRYTFDVSAIADPQHLWFGFLDADLPGYADRSFSLSVWGEGEALFRQTFSGTEHLDLFNDEVLDLGSWADLVGSDGLFNLDVFFSGNVPSIEFAFGDAAAAVSALTTTGVPEPSALVLLATGMLGILAAHSRRRRRSRVA